MEKIRECVLYQQMPAYIPVPTDLIRVKTKIFVSLTKREWQNIQTILPLSELIKDLFFGRFKRLQKQIGSWHMISHIVIAVFIAQLFCVTLEGIVPLLPRTRKKLNVFISENTAAGSCHNLTVQIGLCAMLEKSETVPKRLLSVVQKFSVFNWVRVYIGFRIRCLSRSCGYRFKKILNNRIGVRLTFLLKIAFPMQASISVLSVEIWGTAALPPLDRDSGRTVKFVCASCVVVFA